jgi:hypothetical protein
MSCARELARCQLKKIILKSFSPYFSSKTFSKNHNIDPRWTSLPTWRPSYRRTCPTAT